MASKIGRNEPCPCGSGKKHKRCCGSATTRVASNSTQSQPAASTAATSTLKPIGDWMLMEDDDLDELSNAVVDMLKQGRIADAEAAWQQLNDKYPDMIDPLDRKAMILEAKGEYAEAADYYRQAAEYARTHDGFEDESVQFFLAKAQHLASATAAP
jgi:tetratricopeptide (TPR) repeat protein